MGLALNNNAIMTRTQWHRLAASAAMTGHRQTNIGVTLSIMAIQSSLYPCSGIVAAPESN